MPYSVSWKLKRLWSQNFQDQNIFLAKCQQTKWTEDEYIEACEILLMISNGISKSVIMIGNISIANFRWQGFTIPLNVEWISTILTSIKFICNI